MTLYSAKLYPSETIQTNMTKCKDRCKHEVKSNFDDIYNFHKQEVKMTYLLLVNNAKHWEKQQLKNNVKTK